MNVATRPTPPVPDLAAEKVRQRAVWSAGDYPAIGATLQIVGERLAEAMDLRPDSRVLDVAAGNGNATLAAARRFCNVVSTDFVGAWLRAGMARAEAERLRVAFREADAEDLPFEAGSFDAVMSTFGVMFTVNQEEAAAELMRVCRPGGRIGLANWTPAGFIGQVLRKIGEHAPHAMGVRSPLEWGTEARLNDLFGERTEQIDIKRRHFTIRMRSPEFWVENWRRIYGPMERAFDELDREGAIALEEDLIALARTHSQDRWAMIVPAEYAEIIIHKN